MFRPWNRFSPALTVGNELLNRSVLSNASICQSRPRQKPNGFWLVSCDCQRAGTSCPAGRTADKHSSYGLTTLVSRRILLNSRQIRVEKSRPVEKPSAPNWRSGPVTLQILRSASGMRDAASPGDGHYTNNVSFRGRRCRQSNLQFPLNLCELQIPLAPKRGALGMTITGMTTENV